MKKEQTIGSRVPQDMIRDLETIEEAEQTDRSTTIRKLLYRAIEDWKLSHYASHYSDGRTTLARAAEDAGVSVWEMLDYLRHSKVSAQYDLEDLEHDLEVLKVVGP